MQVAAEPTVPEKKPVLGHSATQEPSWRKGAPAKEQLRQSELDAPVHVPHEASQGWQ